MNYAQKRQAELTEAYNIGCRIGWQRHSDAVAVVMRDEAVMGRPIPRERILAINEAAIKYDHDHIKAFAVRGKESGERRINKNCATEICAKCTERKRSALKRDTLKSRK